jgi:hypothetical protein
MFTASKKIRIKTTEIINKGRKTMNGRFKLQSKSLF